MQPSPASAVARWPLMVAQLTPSGQMPPSTLKRRPRRRCSYEARSLRMPATVADAATAPTHTSSESTDAKTIHPC